jgi:hypothetical protein
MCASWGRGGGGRLPPADVDMRSPECSTTRHTTAGHALACNAPVDPLILVKRYMRTAIMRGGSHHGDDRTQASAASQSHICVEGGFAWGKATTKHHAWAPHHGGLWAKEATQGDRPGWPALPRTMFAILGQCADGRRPDNPQSAPQECAGSQWHHHVCALDKQRAFKWVGHVTIGGRRAQGDCGRGLVLATSSTREKRSFNFTVRHCNANRYYRGGGGGGSATCMALHTTCHPSRSS